MSPEPRSPPRARESVQPRNRSRRVGRLLVNLSWWSLWATACASHVARNLDDATANQVIVALQENGIAGAKDSDAENEGSWVVSVPRTEVPEALSVMSHEGLPSKERPGVIDSVKGGAIIPSLQTEHARLLAGVAGDLEKSLAQLEGVVSVRVHIAAVPLDPLAEPNSTQAASASVLIRHNKKYPNLSNENVQRLVAGAVPNLLTERVAVITVPVNKEPGRTRQLVALGPFAVARESATGLRWLVCGFAFLNLVLLTQVLLFWRKIRVNGAVQPEGSGSSSLSRAL